MLAATILGSSIVFIDGTVVNVALPRLQTVLNATGADVQWVVESYALLLAALLLVGGSLGDRWGRRRVFALGVALFAAASVWCGLSPNVDQLILARAFQGAGGALLTPNSLALISASFSVEQRGRAIGTWSGFTAITAAVGPLLGGWLIENASWRWIFFVNVPLALVVLGIVWARVPESRSEDEPSGGLDWAGAGLATLGLGALVYGLIEAGTRGLGHPQVLGVTAAGVAALAAFVWVEARAARPMMPLVLFRSRTFTGANVLTLLLYAALGGALFFLPFNLIQVQGYTPTGAGAALLPLILTMFLLSRWSGGLIGRYGPRLPLMVGPVLAAVGFAGLALPGLARPSDYWTTFFPAILVLGVGMVVSVAPLTTIVMAAVDDRNAGIASAINNAASRAAGLIAVALLGIVVAGGFNRSLDRRLPALNLTPDIRQALDRERTNLAGARIPDTLVGEARAQLERTIDTAFVDGFRIAMGIAAALALVSALSAALLIEDKIRK